MSIVTKKGDEGQTSLYGGERVLKSAARIEAYGDIDELNSVLGFARALGLEKTLDSMLWRIQTELMTVGAVLATPLTVVAKAAPVSPTWALVMEAEIEDFEKSLPPLRQFIVPGGAQTSAALHMARAVARRAERKAVALSQHEEVPKDLLVYLNRLSDLLFMMARAANREAGIKDVPFKVPKTTPSSPPSSLA